MHNQTPGVLLSYRGHTLTVLEGHALVFGLVGLLFGLSTEARNAIDTEAQYFLGSLIGSYLLGRWLSRVL